MESAIIDPTGIYIYSNLRACNDHFKALCESDVLPYYFSFYKDASTIRGYNPSKVSRSIFNETQFRYDLKKVK